MLTIEYCPQYCMALHSTACSVNAAYNASFDVLDNITDAEVEELMSQHQQLSRW